jgi:hypothetical protein
LQVSRNLMRVATVILIVSLPAFAQNLADPGRRVPENELQLDPPKRDATEEARSYAVKPPPPRAVDPRACESARVNWELACGAPYSYKSRSQLCAEAYAIYRGSCG